MLVLRKYQPALKMSATVFTPAPAHAALGSNGTHQHAVNEPEVVEYVCQCPGPYHECPFSDCSCDWRRCSRCAFRPGVSGLTMQVLLADLDNEDNYISDAEVASYYIIDADVDAEGDSGC